MQKRGLETVRVKADELQKACQGILVKYGKEAEMNLTEISKDVSRKAVSDLKSTSPSESGRYARNWTHKKEKKAHVVKEIVYNRKPTYRVAHLLNNGHKLKNGRFWTGDNHITKVEEKFTEIYLEEVLNRL